MAWAGDASTRLPAAQARALAADALRGLGLEEEAANVVADHLLDAHARQDQSTGLASIVALEQRLAADAHRSRPMATVRETPTMALVDGGGNVGYVVAHHVTRLAIDKAMKQGISCVAASNTHDLGRLAYYPELAARSGLSATCAALVQGETRGDGSGAAPAVLARLLSAVSQDLHAPVRAEDGVAFVVVVMDPRRLVAGIGWPDLKTGAPVADTHGKAPQFIDIPQQLHRSLLKLGGTRPAVAA